MACENQKCICTNCISDKCACDGNKECVCFPETGSCCCNCC